MGLGLWREPGAEIAHWTSRVWMGASPKHRHIKCAPHTRHMGMPRHLDPCSERHSLPTSQRAVCSKRCSHITAMSLPPGSPTPTIQARGDDGHCPQPHVPRALHWEVPQEGASSPGSPASPPKGLQILTLPSHHPLGVPLGQHPRVPIEAGLLHLREKEEGINTTITCHLGARLKSLRAKNSLRTVCWQCLSERDIDTAGGRWLWSDCLQSAVDAALSTTQWWTAFHIPPLGRARLLD